MIEFAALTYGMVLSFVFASLHGNAKRQQKNPPIMILVGYFLVGVTALLCHCTVTQPDYMGGLNSSSLHRSAH
jgi:hypothetical protein